MNWFRRLFGKKPELRLADFISLGPRPVPVPPCPFGCDKRVLHDVIMGGAAQDIRYRVVCDHQIQATERAAFDQRYTQLYDPDKNEWLTYPRR